MMAVLSFVVFAAIAPYFCQSLTNLTNVKATVVNSTGEYYISSVSGNFESNSINCTQKNCVIVCDTYHGCFGTSIDASAADTLSLTCSATYACGQITKFKGPNGATTIVCKERYSCWNNEFGTRNTDVYVTALGPGMFAQHC